MRKGKFPLVHSVRVQSTVAPLSEQQEDEATGHIHGQKAEGHGRWDSAGSLLLSSLGPSPWNGVLHIQSRYSRKITHFETPSKTNSKACLLGGSRGHQVDNINYLTSMYMSE